jgi:hypothetical protein
VIFLFVLDGSLRPIFSQSSSIFMKDDVHITTYYSLIFVLPQQSTEEWRKVMRRVGRRKGKWDQIKTRMGDNDKRHTEIGFNTKFSVHHAKHMLQRKNPIYSNYLTHYIDLSIINKLTLTIRAYDISSSSFIRFYSPVLDLRLLLFFSSLIYFDIW